MKMASDRIIRKMRLFYKDIELSVMVLDDTRKETSGTYVGRIFTGIQYKDHTN